MVELECERCSVLIEIYCLLVINEPDAVGGILGRENGNS